LSFMKKISLSIKFFIVFLILNMYSNAQSMVKIRFYDSCKDSILKLHYEIDSGFSAASKIYYETDDSVSIRGAGFYTVYVSFPRGNWKNKYRTGYYNAVYDFVIKIDGVQKYTDTIELPRIIFCTEALDDPYYKSYTCDELSNGHVIDYYKNGMKRSEGDYINGWPVSAIKHYDKTGKLIAKEKYDKHKLKRFIWYSKQKNANL
jgi:hypothetical protein